MVDHSHSSWQHYAQLYQFQLDTLNTSDSRSQLYILSQQLTAARLVLAEQPIAVLKHKHSLIPALARIEILYSWCQDYQWPSTIITLLLNASFCSSLNAELLPEAANVLAKHPALACAKYNQQTLPSDILTLLSHCYASQRRLAYTQQLPLSTLVTLSEQLIPNLTAAPGKASTVEKIVGMDSIDNDTLANLRHHMALQIMYSHCEHELSLLALLSQHVSKSFNHSPQQHNITAPPLALKTLLADHSAVAHLSLDDYPQLENYLTQHPVMAEHIMQRASQLNRQRQTITQVKLAISLLGINALPLLLASAELQQQLADIKLPNHIVLEQFTQCLAVALLLLLPEELTEDKANLMAYCLCAPLWLNQQNYLHTIISIKPTPIRLNLPLTRLVTTSDYLTHLNLLLKRYQLNSWQTPATELINYLNRKPSKLNHLSLGLLTAWQAANTTLTYHTLFSHTEDKSALVDTNLVSLQQLLVRLQQLNSANFSYQADELCQLIASKTACYCPLQLNF